ncbi:MAG TPA: PH domain-containing protein, partial [Sphingomicrobium sp.]|nr:PH domain-containing protein [Sphingomicrobium sp.]
MSAEDRAVGEPERLHPLFLLTGLGAALRGVGGAYALIAYLAVTGRLGMAIIGGTLLLVVTGIGLMLYWRRFEYRVGSSEIRIDSGIFSRTHRSIPFDRVQDVDITQGPVARLLGLATVKFETGGSAGSEEGVLRAVALERAESLREMIRAYRSEAPPAEAAGVEHDRPAIYAMSLRRLLLAGLFNFSLAVFAVLFGLSQTMGDVIGFDPLSRSFWETVLSASEPLQRLLLANQVLTAIAGLLSLVLVGVATGIVRTFLRDYGFRLDRTETGLRRRRGLVTLTDVSLPVRRAQAAIVATGPVRERFGWSELKLQSLARDEGGGGDHVLAPLASPGETDSILAALGWRPVPRPVPWDRVSRAYAWVLTFAIFPLFLVAIGQILFIPLVGLVMILVFAVVLAERWLSWRRTGFVLDGDRLLVRSGWWRRRTLVLPIRRIQSIDLKHNLISRWFGTGSLVFGVAGGRGYSDH